MKDSLTEIVFILDRSGSMSRLTNDTIGGYNAFIEQQKKEPGEAMLTTVLFDDKYELLHDGVVLKDVKPLTDKEYFARGTTALMDAVGRTINDVGNRLSKLDEAERPGKVVVVITTDGMENASKEFSKKQIKDMITHQTEKYNWQFMFLGANIDAASEAESIGIPIAFAANFTASKVGTDALYKTMSKTVTGYRSTGEVSDSWAGDLKIDL